MAIVNKLHGERQGTSVSVNQGARQLQQGGRQGNGISDRDDRDVLKRRNSPGLSLWSVWTRKRYIDADLPGQQLLESLQSMLSNMLNNCWETTERCQRLQELKERATQRKCRKGLSICELSQNIYQTTNWPLCHVLNSPSEDGPGIMHIMHIMSPHLKKRKLHQGITKNTLAEASYICEAWLHKENQDAQPMDIIDRRVAGPTSPPLRTVTPLPYEQH
jgi:hypothetical protein